ncbi:hypothetical protein BJY24_006819 [Nocardia transvalensis]|uniref:Uncharacterized protein n=1 Tax=Nocardia transvalensis TaxID=37333 RepID=A0A7W9PKW4_9NOCA|nr:hypothetical protein [Nocardia transvalensis]MBB5917907.1 hypothetical protein [Nocardia transvalensis]
MMRSIGSLTALSAVGLTAAAAVIGTAAPASADTNGGKFTKIYSLTNGPCVAVVDSSVGGDTYPSSAGFTVSATLIGVGPCSLDVTLNWRNVDTGETGTKTQHASGPGYWGNDGRSAIFSPGIGNFVGTVTTSAGHVPESGEVAFTVHRYGG